MKKRIWVNLVVLVALLALNGVQSMNAPAVARELAEKDRLEGYGQLPLSFIPNQGQVDEVVEYYVQSGNQSLWFTNDGVTMALSKTTLRLEFVNANPSVQMEGGNKLPGIFNYFVGNDPAKWQTGIPTYGRLTYNNLWPGVNLSYEGQPGALKSTFTIIPGADPTQIRLSYPNTDSPAVDQEGNLVISVNGRKMTESAPLAWQEIAGQRVPVAVTYQVSSQNYGFALPEGYEPAYPLVIDPKLVYSTFLGGSENDMGYAIAVDGLGSAYVTGWTYSSDFPTTPGAFDTTHNGINYDAFVVKLNASGSGLVYGTFLGGDGGDRGGAIAVDEAGNAYVTGNAGSVDFPTTPGAFDRSCGTDGTCNFDGNIYADAFVVKLNAAGSGLVYSTFLGGANVDSSAAIAVDEAGNAYVTGSTYSSDFPTTPGAFDTTCNSCPNQCDVFVVKLNTTGSALTYSTFLGGSSYDWSYGIAVDEVGSAYITGDTHFSDFPTTPGAFDTSFDGTKDAFVVKLNAAGIALDYATFLGGSVGDWDVGCAIAVDEIGNTFVTGYTEASDFPTTQGAFDTSHNDGEDAFVVKLNAAGSGLVYSTFLGGYSDDESLAIAVDEGGNAYVTGWTRSSDFPTTPGAFDTSKYGQHAFVVKVNVNGESLVYSTFLGGSDPEKGYAIAVDGEGSAYITGETYSSDFPTTPGAFDISRNRYWEGFVAKLDLRDAGEPTHTISGYVRDGNNNPLSGVTVNAGSSSTTTTNASGAYILTVTAGVYPVVPSKSGYSFSPSRRIVELSQDVESQDFVGVADGGSPASFLDLPFNYGGSLAVFEQATRNWSEGGGWLQSWFDHKYPNYSKNDGTGIWVYRQAYIDNPRWQGSLLCYGDYCYDGHNALDFAGGPSEIHSAAPGVVAEVCRTASCSRGASYGNYVVINHGGGYASFYAHLASVNEWVNVGTNTTDPQSQPIGIMGGSGGWPVHLHFGIYFDANSDGQWVESEVVDPFGWYQSGIDPWVQNYGGPVSHRLWIHNTGDEKTFLGSEGSSLKNAANTIQAEVSPDTFPGQVTLELSPGPVAQASAQLRSVGRGFWLRLLQLLSLGGDEGLQSQGIGAQNTGPFDPTKPITLTVGYTETEVRHLDVTQLSLYHWNDEGETWEALPTALDPSQRQTSGQTTQLGVFDLQAPLLCPGDHSEPNDSYYSASIVATNGVTVTHIFDIPEDEDWTRFTAEAGKTYEISTSNLGSGVDTTIELYDIDGTTLLLSDDNSGGGTASLLEWQAPLDGTYFLRVLPGEGSAVGCDATYSLVIAEKPPPSGGVYLPIILKNH